MANDRCPHGLGAAYVRKDGAVNVKDGDDDQPVFKEMKQNKTKNIAQSASHPSTTLMSHSLGRDLRELGPAARQANHGLLHYHSHQVLLVNKAPYWVAFKRLVVVL